MIQPKKRKYQKEFRGTMTGISVRGSRLNYGTFGLKSMETSWISAAQIESSRRTITHATKRIGKLFIRIFPHKPFTKKAAGSRMGSGKAAISGYVAIVKPGRIMFELSGVKRDVAKEAFRLAAHKLPIKTKFIEND
jgi:large subunit ribosomal protein L16